MREGRISEELVMADTKRHTDESDYKNHTATDSERVRESVCSENPYKLI